MTVYVDDETGRITGPRGGELRRARAKGAHRPEPDTGRTLTFTATMVARCGELVGGEDPEQLALLVQMRDDVERAIQSAVDGMRAHSAATWAEIGDALGVTRQAAQKRYGR